MPPLNHKPAHDGTLIPNRPYDDVGFSRHLGAEHLPPERCADMARLAVPGLYAPHTPPHIDEHTSIAASAVRTMTVADATVIYARCLGR